MSEKFESEYTKFPINNGAITVETFDGKHFNICIGDQCEKVSRDDLYGLLFFFGDERQQEDLIPVVQTKVRAVERLLSLKLQKDMRKGEIVKARFTYFMPEVIVEKLLINNPEKYRLSTLPTEKLLKDVNKII